jgi:hypothetical protein
LLCIHINSAPLQLLVTPDGRLTGELVCAIAPVFTKTVAIIAATNNLDLFIVIPFYRWSLPGCFSYLELYERWSELRSASQGTENLTMANRVRVCGDNLVRE